MVTFNVQLIRPIPLKGDSYFREIYLREVDRLAETLYVPNYRRPEVRRYAFERSGSEFIMAVPGPADTAVGSLELLSTLYVALSVE